jgi:hypothetical protein
MVFHVSPNRTSGRWLVVIEGADDSQQEFSTKAEALEAARKSAHPLEKAEIKIHDVT